MSQKQIVVATGKVVSEKTIVEPGESQNSIQWSDFAEEKEQPKTATQNSQSTDDRANFGSTQQSALAAMDEAEIFQRALQNQRARLQNRPANVGNKQMRHDVESVFSVLGDWFKG
jgi:hypothetical protein